jgi:predicted GIY-YIG superfamily endonuclease
MYYVYLLQSINNPDKTYIGYTTDLEDRLAKHNSGGSVYTSDYRPWQIVSYHVFMDKSKAIAFESYLKSQSGRAFARKRTLELMRFIYP